MRQRKTDALVRRLVLAEALSEIQSDEELFARLLIALARVRERDVQDVVAALAAAEVADAIAR